MCSSLSPRFWWFVGNLCHSLACRSVTVISACIFTYILPVECVCVQMSPFYKVTTCIGLGPVLMSSALLNDLQRTYFQIRPHSWVKTSIFFSGDKIQPIIGHENIGVIVACRTDVQLGGG